MDYKLKLNIKSIVLYERLTGESFSQFSPTTEKVLPLLYCVLVANNDFTTTFEDTVEYLFSDQEFLSDITRKLENLLKFQGQFARNFIKDDTEEEKVDNSDPVFVSQLIPILISDCGLSIEYVMSEMNYLDIDDYIHYRDERYRSDMEDKRFWTYLSMLPHIDSKKCKIESLIEFPWEKKRKKKEALETIKRDRAKFEEFMKSGSLKVNKNK